MPLSWPSSPSTAVDCFAFALPHSAQEAMNVDRSEPAASETRKRGENESRERDELDRRVLVLVRSGKDRGLARIAGDKVGARLDFVDDIPELARSMASGVGAALLAGELLHDGLIELRRVLEQQEEWSELPLIVLFRKDAPASVLDTLEEFEQNARVKLVLLHRPVPPLALASAMRSALKSRARQYEVRDLLWRLNEDVRLRDQYLATLGHELRNPLSSIGYVSEIFSLAGDALTTDQARWGAEVIARQFRHLSRLLNQLLDVARIQRGKIRLEPAPVDMRAIARRAAESFEMLAKQRDFVLSVPVRPVLVRADPLRLTQMVENLLDNAYKYTEEGGRIRVRVTAGDEEACVTVIDDGRGIDASSVPHVFEPFFQAPEGGGAGSRGLGLGLAMVENLARLHGGRVLARSAGLGRGAEFELRLPVERAEWDEREETTGSEQGAGTDRALGLLVIEDDADGADALAELLRSLGHEASVAYDGTSGLRALDEREFDLVIIDLGLPDIDGKEVAYRIRDRLGARSPMLVALTGQPDSKDDDVFDEFLLKPIGLEQVEQLCARSA
nr:hypothetical protein [Gammaproteobacteria bacterium]